MDADRLPRLVQKQLARFFRVFYRYLGALGMPVFLAANWPQCIQRNPKPRAGSNWQYIPKQRSCRIFITRLEVFGSSFFFYPRFESRNLEQLLDFRDHRHNIRTHPQIERLDSEPVARKDDLVSTAIEDNETPHATTSCEAIGAPFCIRSEDHFGVRRRAKDVPEFFEFSTKLDEI